MDSSRFNSIIDEFLMVAESGRAMMLFGGIFLASLSGNPYNYQRINT